ncbi:MAG: alanine--tRNA ligase [Terracidiphilus sp.]|jgi:alanyl-tRNA synthetase
MKDVSGNNIRETFLRFFETKGHRRVHSSSLVPANDPTLLFTNAGMNQFKDLFLGAERRAYSRATTSQKCVRAGGKHNDLENVGFTRRHHTFFEMLGNFSFGDYFKREAIEFAWELVTSDEWFGIPKDRLYVTIFEGDPANGVSRDDEAEGYWMEVGVPKERIFQYGLKDNFWQMGETGPCGPCSEIFYDMGLEASEHGKDLPFGQDDARYVEIWNLVFMQFDRAAIVDPATKATSYKLTPLPKPSIDTGMGLERVAAVLQGKISNFETDLFVPLIRNAYRLVNQDFSGSVSGARSGSYSHSISGSRSNSDEELVKSASLRIIADHARAATFLINDGVVPSNEGRGYVLRKILRRGIRHGRLLGQEQPFLFEMVYAVRDLMLGAYPELADSAGRIAKAIHAEELQFDRVIETGFKALEENVEESVIAVAETVKIAAQDVKAVLEEASANSAVRDFSMDIEELDEKITSKSDAKDLASKLRAFSARANEALSRIAEDPSVQRFVERMATANEELKRVAESSALQMLTKTMASFNSPMNEIANSPAVQELARNIESFNSRMAEIADSPAVRELTKSMEASQLKMAEIAGSPAVQELTKSMEASQLKMAESFAAKEIARNVQEFSIKANEALSRIAATKPKIAGDRAFHLYETFGLPLDFMVDAARDAGLAFDSVGFEAARAEEQARARASWKGGSQKTASPVLRDLPKTSFLGYRQLTAHNVEVLALVKDGLGVPAANAGDLVDVVLDQTSFYGDSGGQVGDTGLFLSPDGNTTVAEITGCVLPVQGVRAHKAVLKQPLAVGDHVNTVVDGDRRNSIRRNHTGTHLLHAALRQVLGTHVKQAGSLVEPGRLRFDFSHFAQVADEELQEIEDIVNREVLANAKVDTLEDVPIDVAVNEYHAMALFGEKYGDKVRVVKLSDGFSTELCGGTHTGATGEIGLLKLVSESSVSSGVRRIEAISGMGSLDEFRRDADVARVAAQVAGTAGEMSLADSLRARLAAQEDEMKRLRRELEEVRMKSAAGALDEAVAQGVDVKGVRLVVLRADSLERGQLRTLVDNVKQKLGEGVVVLASAQPEGKVSLIAGVTPGLTKRIQAGKLVGAVAKLVGGSGGGKAEIAEAGGKDQGSIDAALRAAAGIVGELLG